MHENIRAFARGKGNAASLFGKTFKVGQHGKDIVLYNGGGSLEIQNGVVYPSLESSESPKENYLDQIENNLTDRLDDGNKNEVKKLLRELKNIMNDIES